MTENKKAVATSAKPKSESKKTSKPEEFFSCPVLDAKGKPTGKLIAISKQFPAKSIGEHCNRETSPVKFKFLGHDVTIPGGKNFGPKFRWSLTAAKLLSVVFDNKEATDEADAENRDFVKAIVNKGFHTDGKFTKTAVLRACEIVNKDAKSVVNLTKTAVNEIQENRVMITRTETANKLNRMIKEKGLSAAVAEVNRMIKEGENSAPVAKSLLLGAAEKSAAVTAAVTEAVNK